MGAISFIAGFQMTYKVGFGANWWGNIGGPLSLLVMISGWVIYRYRQTRVLTMAQFFEIRYSRKFRIFAGIVCFTSGILNFGIFPAVSANFFVNFCGFPEQIGLFGLTISTFALLVIGIVTISLIFTFMGGQIAVLVTDFFQGFFSYIVLVIILIVLLVNFRIIDVFDALLIAPPGKSMINPFKVSNVEDFNIWFFVIGFIAIFYNRLSWQGNQGFNCSAKNPHEAKMAGSLGFFRGWGFMLTLSLLPLYAYMLMHHPKYQGYAQQITHNLSKIQNVELRDQMITPMAMTTFLPTGLMGAFTVLMIAATISTHNSYMHSWGSIFVQDVILPLRKKPLLPQQHLKYLKLSIAAVAAFICIFSLVFRQTQHILLFFALTGAIWMGGVGAAIIGGLYWSRGTTAAAWIAMIIGSGIAFGGMLLDQIWNMVYHARFPVNGQWMYLIAMIAGSSSYFVVSMVGKKQAFNMDKLLHRGKYSENADSHTTNKSLEPNKWNIKCIFGITNEFSFADKCVYAIMISYTTLVFICFIVMTVLALLFDFSDKGWSNYHRYRTYFDVLTSFVIAVWLSCGGVRDIRNLFRELRVAKRDFSDDGRVESPALQSSDLQDNKKDLV
ncbi:MAG: sodium:solute symporter family protein [Sedimentisphaerales bacterium]